MASVPTIIHAFSLVHLYNQLNELRIGLKYKTVWISCTVIDDEDSSIAELYSQFVSVLYSTLINTTVSRAMLHLVDRAVYIGWINDSKYAINVDRLSFAEIKPDLTLCETDTLITEIDCIRQVPVYISKISPIYDCNRTVYSDCCIPNSQLSTVHELYVRLRGYDSFSAVTIADDLAGKDLYSMSVLIAPFTVDQIRILIQKWPIYMIGIGENYIDDPAVDDLLESVHLVVCIYDRSRPSGLLSNSIFNMYVPHSRAEIMYS